MEMNATILFAAPSSDGIAIRPPSGCLALWNAGGPGWAGGRSRGFSSETSANAGGSCAPDGTLRFNWRAMMLKPALIEYVVVHELAHLTHRNHSADFWRLLSMAMPDAQQHRNSLREEGRRLPM